nr:MAG TPA: hypothetical protein [Bacteriophage sp.]
MKNSGSNFVLGLSSVVEKLNLILFLYSVKYHFIVCKMLFLLPYTYIVS